MKKIIYLFIVFLLSINAYSQNDTNTQKTFKVYEVENGLPLIKPSSVVIKKGDTVNVYSTQLGIRKLFPRKTYRIKNNVIEEYKFKNNLPTVIPSKIITQDKEENLIWQQ